MPRPYVSYPKEEIPGENHRTVNIRYRRESVSLKCKDQTTANRLGKRLVHALCEAFPKEVLALESDKREAVKAAVDLMPSVEEEFAI